MNILLLGYILPALNKSFDFINLMTYDMHTTIEMTVDHLAPLYERPWDADLSDEKNNADYAVNYYITNGVSPSKLILDIPVYGNTEISGQLFKIIRVRWVPMRILQLRLLTSNGSVSTIRHLLL